MNLLPLVKRCVDIVEEFSIELSDIRVLTECANGPFVSTALIAAISGANVVALNSSNRYGKAQEKLQLTNELARSLGIERRISVVDSIRSDEYSTFDLVTNLGPVRPINESAIARMKPNSVIALMCEAWEVRPADVDIDSAKQHGLTVLETNEKSSRLRTFEYLGPLAFKLLSERDSDIFYGRLVVIGSGVFAAEITDFFRGWGRQVIELMPGIQNWENELASALREPCTIVFAENEVPEDLLPLEARVVVAEEGAHNFTFVHIAGALGEESLRLIGGTVVPRDVANFPQMSVTTHHVGSEPVVRLHAAGLAASGGALKAIGQGLTSREISEILERDGLGSILL